MTLLLASFLSGINWHDVLSVVSGAVSLTVFGMHKIGHVNHATVMDSVDEALQAAKVLTDKPAKSVADGG